MLEQQDNLYPTYEYTADILAKMDVHEDFESTGEIRYTHRTMKGYEIYFVSNRKDSPVKSIVSFV